jgi:cytochrome P450
MLILALHPEVQHKAQAAIDAHFGGARLPDYEQDWRSVPYIDALLAETHRYNPPAPMGIPHVATNDDSYHGVFIPKGSSP